MCVCGDDSEILHMWSTEYGAFFGAFSLSSAESLRVILEGHHQKFAVSVSCPAQRTEDGKLVVFMV